MHEVSIVMPAFKAQETIASAITDLVGCVNEIQRTLFLFS